MMCMRPVLVFELQTDLERPARLRGDLSDLMHVGSRTSASPMSHHVHLYCPYYHITKLFTSVPCRGESVILKLVQQLFQPYKVEVPNHLQIEVSHPAKHRGVALHLAKRTFVDF